MHLRKTLLLAIALWLPMSLLAGEPGKLREIDVKSIKKIEMSKGGVKSPQVITTAEEFDKAIPDGDAIKKQFDLTKDKLLLFTWAGSGGDKLAAKISDDGKTVNFHLTPGLTRDLRRHVHLYAIPKDAKFEVESGRGGK